jgi:GntR family transcriptional regulator
MKQGRTFGEAIPLYFQLPELLEREVTSGRWNVGAHLPSEPDLCGHFDVSRTTLRQALSRLEQRGLTERIKGRGTFVQPTDTGLSLLQSSEDFFQDEIDRLGHAVTSRLLRAERGPLPPWACDALGLPSGGEGATLERLRSVDGVVALYVVNHLIDDVANAAFRDH